MGLSFSTMYLMTLNRLLVALYPFRYRRSMTKRKFTGLVLSVSITVSTIFCTGCYLSSNSGWWMMLFGGVVLNLVYIVYFIFCVCSYILILKKLINSQQATRTNMQHESSSNTDLMFIWKELRRRGYIIPLTVYHLHVLNICGTTCLRGGCLFLYRKQFFILCRNNAADYVHVK